MWYFVIIHQYFSHIYFNVWLTSTLNVIELFVLFHDLYYMCVSLCVMKAPSAHICMCYAQWNKPISVKWTWHLLFAEFTVNMYVNVKKRKQKQSTFCRIAVLYTEIIYMRLSHRVAMNSLRVIIICWLPWHLPCLVSAWADYHWP